MKKIGQYLPVAFALLALVMLLITARVNDTPAGSPASTTEPTAQTTAPTSAPTQPTAEEPLPADAMSRVKLALDRHSPDETAISVCVYDDALHASDPVIGAGEEADAYALAKLCGQRQMNPIAAFWALEEEGLYRHTPEEGTLDVAAFSQNAQARKEYAYSPEGTRELLTDILTLAGSADDGMDLEGELLGEDGKVNGDQVHRAEGDCFYAYFVYYGDSSAHFLCFYTRGSKQIEDVEFQLLNLRYADGNGEVLEHIDRLGDRQAASLMAAAEQLLTGSSRADEGSIPQSYTCGGSKVTVRRYSIAGTGETGALTNYDLHVEG